MNLQAKSKISVSISIMLTIFCTKNPNIGTHPHPSLLPQEEEIAFTINMEDTDETTFSNILPYPESERFQIGNDSLLANIYHGILPYHFAIDSQKRLYIAQWTTNTINVYSQDGEYLYSIGKSGFGPGELQRLRYFTFDSSYQTLYVLDQYEVEIFTLIETSYEFKDSFKHNLFLPETMCVLGSNLYISGFINNKEQFVENIKGINGFDLKTLEHKNTFGYTYYSFQKILVHTRTLSSMLISCNKETNTVVGQLREFPYMFGYTKEGEEKWSARIGNFESAQFPETSEPSMTLRPNKDFYNHFFPFRATDLGKYELIQIGYRYPSSQLYKILTNEPLNDLIYDGPEVTSVLVNTNNGELIISNRYPIVGAVKDSLIITADRGDSIPQAYTNTFYFHEF